MSGIKEELVASIHAILNKRYEEALESVGLSKESRDQDSKSSAGDKHETARAMAQIELDKNEAHLSKIIQQIKEFSRIDFQKKYELAETGSLVVTNRETYLFSIGFGKLIIKDKTIYILSLSSPIGQFFANKSKGYTSQFQERDYRILDIY